VVRTPDKETTRCYYSLQIVNAVEAMLELALVCKTSIRKSIVGSNPSDGTNNYLYYDVKDLDNLLNSVAV
jgi:hypothetical protein